MTDLHQNRIPTTLQAVFLASNRGQDVHEPPPDRAGNKVFLRNWFFQRRAGSNSSQGGSSSSMWSSIRNFAKGGAVDHGALGAPGSIPSLSPQAYLDAMIRSRGYSTKRYMTLITGYYNKPTPLQNASYSKRMIELVRANDADGLDELLSAGLSPNPCNNYGESIVHMVSRRGDAELLRVLLKHGCSIQVADDYGRTPLHDACWSANPALDVFHLIVERDRHLLHMQDKRGCLPLSYIRAEHWAEWNAYLSKMMDVYWPVRSLKDPEPAPPLTMQKPNSRPLPDPPGALPVEMAEMVSSCRLKPNEARVLVRGNLLTLKWHSMSEDTVATADYESAQEDEEDEDGSDWDSEDEEDDGEEELNELLIIKARLSKQ